MTSFRYRDRETIIHRANPFGKLAWAGSILVVALIVDSPLLLAILFMSTIPVVLAAQVGREWASFMRFALYLCVAIIVINTLVSYHGTHVLVEAPFRIPVMGTPVITLEAIVYGAAMCLRLLAIVSAFAIVTFTVHPDDMMLAMIGLRLPYRSVLVASLSSRFMPTLIDDAERITDVQRCRGLELDRGQLVQKVRGRMAVLIPLLSNSLDRTVQVAEAMESRAFGSGRKRTFYKRITWSAVDVVGLMAALSPLAFGVFVRLGGYASYQYYPTLGRLDLSSLDWSMLVILAVLVTAVVPVAVVKRKVELD
ncbi:MAG: energy-coupling factor transporter transmembrane component T [Chloroflexota bacterium]|nr:energy-coupling factor transporter transmembrane component T [Chloroflexota bacterium]